jgi:hypothetical protein
VVAVRAHVIAAVILGVVGVLFLALVLQSSTAVLWTGTRVDGYSQGGITYFTHEGSPNTIVDENQDAGDTARVPPAVYVPADDPGNARQDSPLRLGRRCRGAHLVRRGDHGADQGGRAAADPQAGRRLNSQKIPLSTDTPAPADLYRSSCAAGRGDPGGARAQGV